MAFVQTKVLQICDAEHICIKKFGCVTNFWSIFQYVLAITKDTLFDNACQIKHCIPMGCATWCRAEQNLLWTGKDCITDSSRWQRKKCLTEHLRTLSSVYIRKSSHDSWYFYQTSTVVLWDQGNAEKYPRSDATLFFVVQTDQ